METSTWRDQAGEQQQRLPEKHAEMLPYGALTGDRGEGKILHVVLLPQKLKYRIIDKDNKKTVCRAISDLGFISCQISEDAVLIKRN